MNDSFISVNVHRDIATYRTADELPDSYKVLAPIMEGVPKILDEVKPDEDEKRGNLWM